MWAFIFEAADSLLAGRFFAWLENRKEKEAENAK
jgi:hypothetical protein